MSNTKLWGGRFTTATHQKVDAFNASITFDQLLAQEDIIGSLAHVKMLGHCQIISAAEAAAITIGLKAVAKKIALGEIDFQIADEDIHMNIERMLHAEIGAVAGKLHTARSRNDQVALDLRLYLRQQVLNSIEKILQLQIILIKKAQENMAVIMPGYTHLQRAQPILFAHHLLAYVAMFERDIERLQNSWLRINQLPLGAGALAGTTFTIDRNYVAEILGFDGVCHNSLDAVSDRDFVIEFLADASLIMMHMSRLSEELIIWSSQEFGFIELSDAYCTGSSIMPQKKNPDVPELVRGKTGRVYGALFNLLTMMKGLPLAYNKDLQEDKEPLFDTVNTLNNILEIYPDMLETMQIKSERMLQATHAGFSNATDVADYLVKKGLTFREAHEIVGKIVAFAITKNLTLSELSLQQMQDFSKYIAEDIYNVLKMENVVAARNSFGGTAQSQVTSQLQTAQKKNSLQQQWLLAKQTFLMQKLQLL